MSWEGGLRQEDTTAPGASSSDVCSVLGCMMLECAQSLAGLEHSGYGSPDMVNMMLGIVYYEEEKTK